MRKGKIVIILAAVLCGVLYSVRSAAQDFEEMAASMKRSVAFLCADSLQGRKVGSQGERLAAQYIYKALTEAGITMLTPPNGDEYSIVKTPGDTVKSANIVGIVEGYDPKLKNEYIVIGAHYDHLGVNTIKRNGKEEVQVYPGADDNASGVAVALELAKFTDLNRYLFKRSVIFAFFGGEEAGMTGSWYFANRSFKDKMDKVVLMVNIDMVGRSGIDNPEQAYTITQDPRIKEALDITSQRGASLIDPKLSHTDYFPSDHRTFYENGIPIVLFTTGVHKDYHSIYDTPDKLDYDQMAALVEYINSFAQTVADITDLSASSTPAAVKTSVASNGESIYSQHDVDKKAMFLHGDERQFLDRWVYKYLKYPKTSIKEKSSGKVVVEFVVDKSGNVKDVTIVRSVTPALDDEAIKVVSSSPKWKPAELHGEKVSVKISIPIEFKLSSRSKFGIKKW